MENSNIRVLPRVCGNKSCKELIMTPISEQILKTNENGGSIEVCSKCKDKEDLKGARKLKKGKPILVSWNNGLIKEYESKADASRQLDISTTLIDSFLLKQRPKEIINIEFKGAVKMSDKIYKLTTNEAISMLPNKENVHTFRQGGSGCLIGADWSKESMLEAINNHEFELTGEQATSMGHGIAFQDEFGWVYVQTKGELFNE